MPIRRSYSYKKRPAHRKRMHRASKPAISRTQLSLRAVPDRMTVKLSYGDILTSSTTTAATNLTIRGNGPFDPDFTAAGHQPRGFDEWSAFYDSYTVVSSKLELVPICTNGSLIIAAYPTNTTGGPATVVTALERPRMKYRTLQNLGNPSTKIVLNHSTQQILGIAKTEKFDGDYSAAVTSNPPQQWYYVVSRQHPDATTASTSSLIWKITYEVVFYNRKLLSQS